MGRANGSCIAGKISLAEVDGSEPCPAQPPDMKPAAQSVMEYKTERREYLDW